ncbi:DUF6221 family protein [Streptomyces sp. NPDC001914]|uniref:DUF6221 family protein n=1 Tax=Streptomyces sp. NPDC001914 TaxID=3364623 RepID=UPI0036791100
MLRTADVIPFLRARYQEEARLAHRAAWCQDAATWHAEPSPYGTGDGTARWYIADCLDDGVVSHVDPSGSDDEHVARHIALWDPARVQADSAARERVLDAWEDTEYDVPDYVIEALAEPYKDHPDYPK